MGLTLGQIWLQILTLPFSNSKVQERKSDGYMRSCQVPVNAHIHLTDSVLKSSLESVQLSLLTWQLRKHKVMLAGRESTGALLPGLPQGKGRQSPLGPGHQTPGLGAPLINVPKFQGVTFQSTGNSCSR